MVTGAGGYTGSKLVDILQKNNIDVKAIVRSGSDISRLHGFEDNISYADLSYQNLSDEILEDIDCIYHLAAATSGSHFEMIMNTVVATENLLNSLNGHKIQRFVLVSSFSVYQMTSLKPGSILDETCPVELNLKARDPYSITKLRQENLVQNKCEKMGIPLVIIRPGKIYGPGDHPIPPQLGLNIPGICFLYIGGKNLIPLTHVYNCAEAIFLAGVSDRVDNEIINIVDDNLPTQREYLKLYESVVGKLPRKIWVPYWFFKFIAIGFEIATKKTKGNIPPIITRYRGANLWGSFRYDNTKAKTMLNWAPDISVRDGVKEMLYSHLIA
jgi:nucleoside-diphosphate-sugar epimerase